MKPIIYWTLESRWYPHGSLGVLSVTSEKRSLIYGRNEHGEATHRRRIDCHGKFFSEEEARGHIETVRGLQAKYAAIRLPHKEAIRQSYVDEKEEARRLMGLRHP